MYAQSQLHGQTSKITEKANQSPSISVVGTFPVIAVVTLTLPYSKRKLHWVLAEVYSKAFWFCIIFPQTGLLTWVPWDITEADFATSIAKIDTSLHLATLQGLNGFCKLEALKSLLYSPL